MSLDPTPVTASEPPPSTKRPRGRPRLFDESRRQTLCTLISIGLSRKEACRQVGVPPSSVVHAARTDADFARQLQQALIDRANRPPELADFGSRSWRAVARRLEALSPDFRPPRSSHEPNGRLKRLIRRMVLKVLKKHPLWQALKERGNDRQRDYSSVPAASKCHSLIVSASGRHPSTDYCSETPHDVRAHPIQKQ